MSVFGVRYMALNLMWEWRNVNEGGVGGMKLKQPSMKKWSRPLQGWIKINVDDIGQGNTENIGVACVARDDIGRFLGARSSNCRGYTQIREAEAVGLHNALVWMEKWRTTNCIFELNAKLVVEAVYNNKERSNFHSIIDDCVSSLQYFENVLVVHEYRSSNKVAHMSARVVFFMTGHME
ncbi:uncharacterized protein LOC141700079 [Apium graveolens]|uniref:uncharacterized protein LOC141700079 n=1 Tax=Apium graveolens TaxID=4045 RepID=UPI003D79FE99